MAGPRQAGKTTLARAIAAGHRNRLMVNWDVIGDRRRLIADPEFFVRQAWADDSEPLVVLDEIHKYRRWKAYLKSVVDGHPTGYRFLVTGSGRLDVYQRGGDSLAGRYEMFHLWPLTLGELSASPRNFGRWSRAPWSLAEGDDPAVSRAVWARLLTFSGFPEPYLAGRPQPWRRWSRNYTRQVVREDVRDLTGLRDMDLVETLFHLLPERVGSPLSINALAGVLQVSFHTVKAWLLALERLYLWFRVPPWTARVSRAIQKETKPYLFLTPLVADGAARFENAVALELHRAVHGWNDLGLGGFSLHYVRNKEKQEVDFLVARDRRPWLLVEAKAGDPEPAPALRKFQALFRVPAVQLVGADVEPRVYKVPGGPLVVAPAWRWLAGLP
jgi:predicted AAA+ superfamily ATPase